MTKLIYTCIRAISEIRKILMNLRLLAVITIACFLIVFCLAFLFEVPVAYVPTNATLLEYILYHIVFIILEVSLLSYLFMHMIRTSKLELDKNIFAKK